MYSFSVTRQLVVFFQSVGFGILLGFADSLFFFIAGLFTLRPFCRRVVSDILFSVFLMFSFFCFILSYNLGTVRFHLLLGIFFGAVIYYCSFGQTVGFLLERAAITARYALCLVLKPFKKILSVFKGKINKKRAKKSDKRIAKKNRNVV